MREPRLTLGDVGHRLVAQARYNINVDPNVRYYADPLDGLRSQLTELRGLSKIVPPLVEADRERRWEEISRRPSDGKDGDVVDVYGAEAGPEEGYLRHRARRGRSVQALLDERRQLLDVLEALEQSQATVAAKLRRRADEKPAAREAIAQASRKAQATIERHAERVRHRLLLDDSVLSSHGVRPWEQDN